jgi:hypothetical protein
MAEGAARKERMGKKLEEAQFFFAVIVFFLQLPHSLGFQRKFLFFYSPALETSFDLYVPVPKRPSQASLLNIKYSIC